MTTSSEAVVAKLTGKRRHVSNDSNGNEVDDSEIQQPQSPEEAIADADSQDNLNDADDDLDDAERSPDTPVTPRPRLERKRPRHSILKSSQGIEFSVNFLFLHLSYNYIF